MVATEEDYDIQAGLEVPLPHDPRVIRRVSFQDRYELLLWDACRKEVHHGVERLFMGYAIHEEGKLVKSGDTYSPSPTDDLKEDSVARGLVGFLGEEGDVHSSFKVDMMHQGLGDDPMHDFTDLPCYPFVGDYSSLFPSLREFAGWLMSQSGESALCPISEVGNVYLGGLVYPDHDVVERAHEVVLRRGEALEAKRVANGGLDENEFLLYHELSIIDK